MKVALPLVLLVAALTEAVAVVADLLADPSAAHAAQLNHPTLLLSVTAAVLLAERESVRWSRIAVAAGAAAALLMRAGLVGASFALGGPRPTLPATLLSVAGLILGLALLAATVRSLQRHRDLAEDPEPEPLPAAPGPTRPRHPAAAPAPLATGPWATATTPWPRADEDDPDGTLIRPPRR